MDDQAVVKNNKPRSNPLRRNMMRLRLSPCHVFPVEHSYAICAPGKLNKELAN